MVCSTTYKHCLGKKTLNTGSTMTCRAKVKEPPKFNLGGAGLSRDTHLLPVSVHLAPFPFCLGCNIILFKFNSGE